MNGLIDGAIGRSRMVLAILVCSILAGLATYINIPKEADPDIPIPFVAITIPLAGVTPEDSERLLVRPVEQEIQSLEGLKTFSSFAAKAPRNSSWNSRSTWMSTRPCSTSKTRWTWRNAISLPTHASPSFRNSTPRNSLYWSSTSTATRPSAASPALPKT
jgi:hypothetical protein